MNIEALYSKYLGFTGGDKEMMVRILTRMVEEYQTCEGKENTVREYKAMILMAQ